jgi:hypothetical protein
VNPAMKLNAPHAHPRRGTGRPYARHPVAEQVKTLKAIETFWGFGGTARALGKHCPPRRSTCSTVPSGKVSATATKAASVMAILITSAQPRAVVLAHLLEAAIQGAACRFEREKAGSGGAVTIRAIRETTRSF